LFGESIGSLADISLTLIRLRIHWPTLTIIRCQWSCNRLQYVKLCASSLFFRPYLDVWLLHKKWIDWVRQWFWVESSVLHAALHDILETQKVVIRNLGQRLWPRRSAGRSKDFSKQLSLSIVPIQYNYGRVVTLMLLPFFCIFKEG